jgi:hypothetical protein
MESNVNTYLLGLLVVNTAVYVAGFVIENIFSVVYGAIATFVVLVILAIKAIK